MSSSLDDLFDEDVDDSAIGSRDWMKSESIVTKDGYRDGLAEGQEVKLQEGFNRGFLDGYTEVKDISHLRGRICAKISLKHLLKTDMNEDKIQQLEDLLISVRELEEKCLKMDKDTAKQLLKNPQKSVALESEHGTEEIKSTCENTAQVKITCENAEEGKIPCENTESVENKCKNAEKDRLPCDKTVAPLKHSENMEKEEQYTCSEIKMSSELNRLIMKYNEILEMNKE